MLLLNLYFFMNPKPLIIANWKMNPPRLKEAEHLFGAEDSSPVKLLDKDFIFAILKIINPTAFL